ncbi:MAG: hypothetical protein WCL44_13265 [bacterium]
MQRIVKGFILVSAVCVIGLMSGCGGSDNSDVYNPSIDPANFVAGVDNPFFPLVPGRTLHYLITNADGTENVAVTTTHDTKVILGVTCVVVHDVVTVDGALAEDTWDWYAQDKDGNVWYFGEDTKKYDGTTVNTEGTWEAGVGGAKPGMVMQSDPANHIGTTFRQEFMAGVAEDKTEVLSVNEAITTPYGSLTQCVMTKDYSDIEPGVVEHKYFASGIGQVATIVVEGPAEREELVSITTE